MATVRIDGDRITDWASFHSTCKEAFGFPEFYGNNMNAFIDCLTYIDEGDGMSNIVLGNGETLTIELQSGTALRDRVPDIYEGLDEAVAFVNDRFLEEGKSEKIKIVLQ